MDDEAANGLGPAPDVGDIMTNRFGPKMPRECALTGGSRRLMRKHGGCRCQGIPEEGLDIGGYANDIDHAMQLGSIASRVGMLPGPWPREASREWPIALAREEVV